MSSFTLSEIANKISTTSDEDVTEQQLFEIIDKVVSFHKNKIFAYYETDDIANEIWIICLRQLQHYVPSRGRGHNVANSLERWLNKVVYNRLANLYRDKYSSVNEKYRRVRMNIINSLPIDGIDTSRENLQKWSYMEDLSFNLLNEEFLSFVESKLPEDLVLIFHDCLAEENVTSYYKSKLRAALDPIIDEWNKKHDET